MNKRPVPGSSKVHVSLGDRSYDILVGQALLGQAPELLSGYIAGRSVFILTDKNVELLHAKSLQKALRETGGAIDVHLMSVLPGEDSKSFDRLEAVLSWLVKSGGDRKSVMITVGGGVVGDLGGFAAAVMMRGIDYIQIPTSLLAQVDSAVGGKTAINMALGKNLVGAFYQPRMVICDLDTLTTLPERQIKAGYAEILKYGLIDDAEFFIWLESHGKDVCTLDMQALKRAVTVSCRKKAEIVAQDEKEAGLRMILNFGHTFAHALEAATAYDGRVLHGEAVSIGMVCALMLSYRLGYCKEETLERPLSHLQSVGLPVSIAEISPDVELSADEIFELMRADKKTENGNPVFILARKIGETFAARDVAKDDIIHILEKSIDGQIL